MVTIAFHPSSLARSHSYLLLTDSCSLVNIRAWSFSRQSHSRLWKSNRWIYSQIVWWDGSTRTDVFCRGDCWKFTGTIGEYNIPWIITTYVFPISFFFSPKKSWLITHTGTSRSRSFGLMPKHLVLSGGSSASLKPSYFVAAYDGIVSALDQTGSATEVIRWTWMDRHL